MCGITGIFAFNLVGKFNRINITAATMSLEKRGPDFQDIYLDDWVGLGHRRLAVIDTSERGHQPMWDETGRYCITFNGEIFNFRDLRRQLEQTGAAFRSDSDTEVLLKLFVREGATCLKKLNGFFAFCIYDKEAQSFFLARDRYGVKPLFYLHDEDKFIFASEMKAMLRYGIDKTVDLTSLHIYLQLNYIPAPATIFTHVKKLLPGHYLTLSKQKAEITKWYEIPDAAADVENSADAYEAAQRKFAALLEDAVQQRLVADVPVGVFLSGGIDSSVITGLASRHKPDLHTFSIGFRDEKFFDETDYANLVAKHFNTNHTVFSLSNDDLLENVEGMLNSIDEPFADSSALNVYILSRQTRKYATVALTGDGADELLGGYHKHEALDRMLHPGWRENIVTAFAPLWRVLPKSRNNRVTNLVRQAHRFASGGRLNADERYWQWAALASAEEALSLLAPAISARLELEELHKRKAEILRYLRRGHNMNDILKTDFNLVLQNDMLVKADSMSMAHGLEIRSPFLDHRLVDFAFSLPPDFKITGTRRKKVLQDAFRNMLPEKLYNRPKKGFEVPLLKWLRRDLKSRLTDELLSRQFIEEQGLFSFSALESLKARLYSSDPGDAPARLWAVIVLQWWWRKHGIIISHPEDPR